MAMNVRYIVTIDEELLLSYELDKLTLKNTSNGTFEKSEESLKCDEHTGSETLLFEDNKSTSVVLFKDSQNCTSETSYTIKKLSTNYINTNYGVHPNVPERGKDVNGNKEPSADEDINDSLHRFYICDSDNEQDDSSEESECTEKRKDLRQRGGKNNRQKRDKPVILCLPDLYDDNSGNHPFNNLNSFSETSEGSESNVTASPELTSTNHQLYDHLTTSGDNNIHELNKDVNSDYGVTDSCLEESGISSVSCAEIDNETFFPLDKSNANMIMHYADDINDKDFNDRLLTQLPDCDSTAFKFSDNGEISSISKRLEVKKNETSRNVKKKKIRKNKLNLKTRSVSTFPPLKSKPLGNAGKERLEAFLCDDKCCAVREKISKNITEQSSKESKAKEDVKVIYIEDDGKKPSENRTNLHNAVLNNEIEEIYCLVETHMEHSNQSKTELNLTDRYKKTALDYAIQNNMEVVIEYLKEKKCSMGEHIYKCTLSME